MSKPLRFAPAGIPLHVRCRGNQRQDIYHSDSDRLHYQNLLVQHCRENAVRIIGYCQMTNHVHLILQPTTDDGLSRAMMRLNSEYAQSTQFRLGRSGHLWQGRFKATPMDAAYTWQALRYVELNPVRAAMVQRAEDWQWSTAAIHLGLARWPDWLDRETWPTILHSDQWHQALLASVPASDEARIRKATRENRPLADEPTIKRWEQRYGTSLTPKPNGRPRKLPSSASQLALFKAAG